MTELDWTLENSALSISQGKEQSSPLNPRYRRRSPPLPELDTLREKVLAGDRTALARAITLVESTRADHQALARQLVDELMPYTGNSYRVGITGVPGVGKSTFIETFGKYLIHTLDRRVAVLAIDPSSGRSGGSILGDKTRMPELSNDPKAFVRPSPSSCSLGGVTRKTRETILLCEAAGFDTLLIETVGVGQSETSVAGMVDFFLLLMLAGAGDELQGIKRGIMEMADGITITKTDGDNIPHAEAARALYQGALHLFPTTDSGWIPRVTTCSAFGNQGMREIGQMLDEFRIQLEQGGHWQARRRGQLRSWMRETIEHELLDRFYATPGMTSRLAAAQEQVMNGEVSPFASAMNLLELASSALPLPESPPSEDRQSPEDTYPSR
jgi:LAO/AO transport system kinase